MDVFKKMTMLSLEQATVLPYLSYRLAMDGMRIIRLEHPVYGDPNRMIGENRLGEEKMYSYFMAINAGKKASPLTWDRRRERDPQRPDREAQCRYFCHEPASAKLRQTGHRLRDLKSGEAGHHLGGAHRFRPGQQRGCLRPYPPGARRPDGTDRRGGKDPRLSASRCPTWERANTPTASS